MKVVAIILAALAAATVSANQAEGPCTMELATSEGDCSAINSCLSTVNVKPGDNAPELTLSGNDCISGSQSSGDFQGAASITVTASGGSASLNIFGDNQDVPKGFAAFIYGASGNSAGCVGSLRVTDGTCFYSDAGPEPPSAAAGTVASVAGLAAAAAAGTAALLL